MITKPLSPASFQRRADHSRDITSEHISRHLEAFEAAGGSVEVLGNTPIAKPVKPAPRQPAVRERK